MTLRSRPRPASRPGFTLLEICLAVGVMGLALVIVVGNIQHSVGMYRVARDTVLATSAAREILEKTIHRVEKHSLSREELRVRTDDGRVEGQPWLRYRIDISEARLDGLEDFELPGVFRVEVVVSWFYRTDRQVRLVHYAGKEGEF